MENTNNKEIMANLKYNILKCKLQKHNKQQYEIIKHICINIKINKTIINKNQYIKRIFMTKS